MTGLATSPVYCVLTSDKINNIGFGYDPRARPYLPHPAFPFVHHPGNFGPRTEQYAPVYPGPGQYGGNGSQPTYGNRFQPPNATNPPGKNF